MESSQSIDRKSFILGMVTAFAECVANECKKGALSPPFYPQDYETVLQEIELREKRLTIDTYATVLLKPGDWPIQSAG